MRPWPPESPVSVAERAPGLLCNLGRTEYGVAHALQTRLVAWRRREVGRDVILVTEHQSVYTLGRRGGREHLAVSERFLAERGIEVVEIERGGVITYHGPGQLVIYPILDLRAAGLSVTDYVARLEELMIALAADVGVAAGRDPRNHGVWVGEKKLGSVGIAIRHGISFHGLALNVNPSLAPFGWINPCGLTGVAMTSLAAESGENVTVSGIAPGLLDHFKVIFGIDLAETSCEMLPV